MKTPIYILLGTLCVAIGVIGIFVPVLPTAPLLLLAAFFYFRSSEKLYNWLLNHNILGPYIYNYITYKAIPLKTKYTIIVTIWCSLGLSIYLVDNPVVDAILVFIGLSLSAYIWSLKTLEQSRKA